MPIFTLTITVAFAALFSHADGYAAKKDQTIARSLENMTYKTGWVLLGAVTEDYRAWAAANDSHVPYKTGGFEIVGKTVDRTKPVLPRKGDLIRITDREPIVILDYATTAEKRRLDPPSSVTRSLGI